VELFIRFFSKYNTVCKIKGKVGIITPYRQQLQELQRHFKQKLPKEIYDSLELNTVDGFQGREKQIIIISCVRANATKEIGFLADIRRMNVALTRAKYSLWVIGNAASLIRNPHWNAFIEFTKQNNCYIETPKLDLLGSVQATHGKVMLENTQESHSTNVVTGKQSASLSQPKKRKATEIISPVIKFKLGAQKKAKREIKLYTPQLSPAQRLITQNIKKKMEEQKSKPVLPPNPVSDPNLIEVLLLDISKNTK